MIYFHQQGTSYRLPQVRLVRSWLTSLAEEEKFKIGEVNCIFCSDEHILSINKQFLDHDYYTDIITFDYNVGHLINSDMYISVDTTKSNAKQLNISRLDEVHRVLAHGVLHLCGYKDKSTEDQALMTKKEDYYLSLRSF